MKVVSVGSMSGVFILSVSSVKSLTRGRAGVEHNLNCVACLFLPERSLVVHRHPPVWSIDGQIDICNRPANASVKVCSEPRYECYYGSINKNDYVLSITCSFWFFFISLPPPLPTSGQKKPPLGKRRQPVTVASRVKRGVQPPESRSDSALEFTLSVALLQDISVKYQVMSGKNSEDVIREDIFWMCEIKIWNVELRGKGEYSILSKLYGA